MVRPARRARAGPLTSTWPHQPPPQLESTTTVAASAPLGVGVGTGAGAGAGAAGGGTGATGIVVLTAGVGPDRPGAALPRNAMRRRAIVRRRRAILPRSTVVQSSRRTPPVSPELGFSAQ